ncbi:MAG: hypothetical protein JO198_10875 [Candidatus Dormibacteraeota bacterium]|nr:hypothetical protein [Candidatus Dormibacteraeota bacterium]
MSRPRIAAAVPLLWAGMSAGGALIAPHTAPSAIGLCSAATYAHRIALVVEHGNGGVIRVCIGFNGSSITAEQALQVSGVEYATVSYGSLGDAVCQIDHEPASYPPSCWTSTSPYWVLFVAHGSSAWSPAARGMSTQTLGDGDAAGFRYDPQSGGAAPPVSASGTCAQSAAATAPPSAPSAVTNPAAAVATASPPADAAVNSAPAASALSRAGAVVPAPQTAAAHPSSGVDAGLLLAAVGGGALAGLLVLQLLRRRRRAA